MLMLNFLVGALANFIGYIPLGNINLTVVQLTINRGVKHAMYFIVSFSAMEFVFTYAIMYFADWFSTQKRLLYWLDWLMAGIFFILAITTWRNVSKEKKIDYSKADSIKHGLVLAFVNPMQIPYWLVVGTYLLSNHWIRSGNGALAIFSLGSSAGTFFALMGFARFSSYLRERFTVRSHIINHGIAIIFCLLGAYYVLKLVVLK